MTIENANRLAEMRRAHGYSQEELAEKLNISRQAVSKWERAESSPDTDNLIALAQLYGVSLDVLLGLQLPPAAQANNDAAEYEAPAETEELPVAASPAEAPFAESVSPQEDSSYDPLPEGSYYDHIAREKQNARKAARKRRRNLPYPVLVTMAYLILGSVFNQWHPGWIIFLTIPLFYLPDSERKPLRLLGNPVMITIIYLLLGFLCHAWHPGWLVFLLIPLMASARR